MMRVVSFQKGGQQLATFLEPYRKVRRWTVEVPSLMPHCWTTCAAECLRLASD